MPESERKSYWKTAAVYVSTLLVLYFLSIGPAYWILFNLIPERHSETALDVIWTVYSPMGWICDLSNSVRTLYLLYVGLWISE